MITVLGEGRGLRIVWLMEEMGLAYRLSPANRIVTLESDPARRHRAGADFAQADQIPGHDADRLVIDPTGAIPAVRDGNVRMLESVGAMEYLMARQGPTPLARAPDEPEFAAYRQFLHLGQAGLAAAIYFVALRHSPEAERRAWGAEEVLDVFRNRLGLVENQLERSTWLAGDRFTAADISMTCALEFAALIKGFELGETVQAYLGRTSERPAFRRARNACHALPQTL